MGVFGKNQRNQSEQTAVEWKTWGKEVEMRNEKDRTKERRGNGKSRTIQRTKPRVHTSTLREKKKEKSNLYENQHKKKEDRTGKREKNGKKIGKTHQMLQGMALRLE